MKAVFLDSATFSDEINLHQPAGLSEYKAYADTIQDDQLIIERCQDADIVIANKVDFNKQILQQLPQLKLIQLTATGTDNINTEACAEMGIQLNNVAGYAVKSVPEHTFMLMLSAMRACRHYHDAVAADAWQKSGKFCLIDEPLLDLEGKTLGIIGAGTIGKRVAEIAKAFGMQVLFAERRGNTPRSSDYSDFEQVLQASDVISLHCPLTADSKQLINKETIALMQRTPLIVNVARGGVVDSQAVADALTEERILGYASDVFVSEPMDDDEPLRQFAQHPRVIFSPHNAWGSMAAQQELWDRVVQKVEAFISS